MLNQSYERMLHTRSARFQCSFSPPSTVHKGHEKRGKCITSCKCTVGPAGSWCHCSFSFFVCVVSRSEMSLGTWCSGITSASHAEGPGFNPQCVHFVHNPICPLRMNSLSWKTKHIPTKMTQALGSIHFVHNPICPLRLNSSSRKTKHIPTKMTPAGFEPAIPGSVGRCLIHWATGPLAVCAAVWLFRHFLIGLFRSQNSPLSLTLR